MYALYYIDGVVLCRDYVVWELCNVEKLHCMWDCMAYVSFDLWDTCSVLGGMLCVGSCWMRG